MINRISHSEVVRDASGLSELQASILMTACRSHLDVPDNYLSAAHAASMLERDVAAMPLVSLRLMDCLDYGDECRLYEPTPRGVKVAHARLTGTPTP